MNRRPTRRALWQGTLILFAAMAPLSCWDEHSDRTFNPRDPLHGGTQPVSVTDLRVDVADRRLELDWQASDAARVSKYYIYKREAGDATAARVDSTESLGYSDLGLVNGSLYEYQVSAVLPNGLEGKRSRRVQASPGLFGLLVESGAARTRNRDVTLQLTAPNGTTGVRVSDQADLSGVPAQSFTATKTWTLPAEDGLYTVYARFTTEFGNESAVFSDDIILDTRASIVSVSHSATATVAPGTTVHFTVRSGEPFGQALIDLGNARTGIVLYDDGTHGDTDPNNGLYEVDYIVEEGIELQDGVVIGRFRDEAGNEAPQLNAPTRLSIHAGPSAVQLSNPTDIQETTISLFWTQARATNFAFYRIIRAETAGALSAPTRVNVTDIQELTTTTFTDQSLEQNTQYFYMVLVYDGIGAFAPSNEVQGRTKDLSPAAVTLETPTAVSRTEVTLDWSRNEEDDFASYKIYRSTQPSVDLSDQLLTTITRSDVTTFRDSGLQENTLYYYRVFVFDNGGTSTPSNEVGPKTANGPPTGVTLTGTPTAEPDEVSLTWTQNNNHDFLEYRVFRDLSPSVGTNSTLARAVTQRTSLNFVDRDLQENTRYYYRVFVADTGDSLAGSNEISVLTANAPPAPVALSLVDTTHTSVTLSWTESDAGDFSSYKVYSQTTPGVSTSGTPYATITQKNRIGIVVTGLSRTPSGGSPGQDYFFVIVVEDDAGGRTPSNELRVRGESP